MMSPIVAGELPWTLLAMQKQSFRLPERTFNAKSNIRFENSRRRLNTQLRKDAASGNPRVPGYLVDQLNKQLESLVYQLIPDDHAAVDPISTLENDLRGEKAIVALKSLIFEGGKVTERGARLLARSMCRQRDRSKQDSRRLSIT